MQVLVTTSIRGAAIDATRFLQPRPRLWSVVLILVLCPYAPSLSAGSKGKPDAAALMITAQRLFEIGPAAQAHPSKDRVREYILGRLAATEAEVRELPFQVRVPRNGRWQLYNLMASFNPNATLRVLLGGHWDTRPWSEADPERSKRKLPTPGANDGISQVAVLLEVADFLGAHGLPDHFGVDIVLFDGEEGPFGTAYYYLGSKHLAPRWQKLTGLSKPSAGVFVDMVGRRGQSIKREGHSERRAARVNDELFGLAEQLSLTGF